ncbi:hypothetical protein V565_330460, partial [Rhizoctonia solani 123E]
MPQLHKFAVDGEPRALIKQNHADCNKKLWHLSNKLCMTLIVEYNAMMEWIKAKLKEDMEQIVCAMKIIAEGFPYKSREEMMRVFELGEGEKQLAEVEAAYWSARADTDTVYWHQVKALK